MNDTIEIGDTVSTDAEDPNDRHIGVVTACSPEGASCPWVWVQFSDGLCDSRLIDLHDVILVAKGH